jgi:hypothetical protein
MNIPLGGFAWTNVSWINATTTQDTCIIALQELPS